MRNLLLFVAVASLSGRASAALPDAGGCPAVVLRTAQAMGTRVRVEVCPRGTTSLAIGDADQAVSECFAEFARLDALWSHWVRESDVSRVNQAAGAEAVRVSAETAEILGAALEGSRRTAGLFDVTFAPLGALWRFETPPGSHEPTRLARVPTPEEVARQKRLVGYGGLEVSVEAATARLARRGMAIHLGGIGKGAAVDRLVALLKKRGFRDFAVQAGGDLYCAGHNGARPWRVGVAHPRAPGQVLGVVTVTDAAFSTSGDYERFQILDGVRYHHLIDLRTGFPATASQSATVLAPTATAAEILTKAAFVLGGREGLTLLAEHGARGVLVTSTGEVMTSENLTMEVAP